jgi:AraC-like DNA-binding protein
VLALIIGIWQLGQALTGKPLDGTAECAFAKPAYALPDGNRLRFGRSSHRLVFATSILDLPLVSADVTATRLATTQLERELAAVIDAGLPGRIRSALGEGLDRPLPEVAKQLHLSTRTLKRKLAEHGTTFSTIRDDLRRQRALLLLDNRGLSIGEIAGRLGYTELPNFTRAFRKWTGMTPLAYRTR